MLTNADKPKPPNAGKGRVKGVPNKTTASAKAALTEAFDKLGGVPALVKWGQAKPSDFYGIWSKLIPAEIKAELSSPGGGPLEIRVTFVTTPGA